MLKLISTTIWYRVHPITGPVRADDPTPTIYPTWRQAVALAKLEAR